MTLPVVRRPVRAVLLVAVLAVAAPAVAAAQMDAPDAPPNLLLITVDTLRADAVGWIGGRVETPAMDALAAEGARFPTAVAPVPITLPAHASILSGLVPARHGVRDNGQTVPDTFPILTERLREAGYGTAAFVSGFPLERIFGLDRGFDHYDDTMNQGSEGWVERLAGDTTAAAASWIGEAAEPWFVWVHYYDPHDPYEPPRAFHQRGPDGAYLGEVAYTDFAIETLMGAIPAPARANLLTVLTADHGESLGEHREKTHGFFVYDSTMVVPLVFHHPGRIAAAGRAAQVRLVDIAPTVLDLLGLPALGGVDGISLAPLLRGRPLEVRAAVIETHLPWIFFGWSPLTGLRGGGWKYIDAPKPELYDLGADPRELANVIAKHPARARAMRAAMAAALPEVSAAAAGDIDPATVEALRALGYIGAGEAPGAPPATGLADPKDRIELRNRLQAAEAELRAGAFAEAIAEFDAVLEVEPDNRFAALRVGIAYLKWGKPALAVPRLRRSIELDPDRAETRFALADALMRLEHWAEAAVEWREVARLQPRRADSWFNLAVAKARSGDPSGARAALAEARSVDGTGEIDARIKADPELGKLLGAR